MDEGERITQMIEFGSVVPEGPNQPYYLVTMAWFTRWQRYTGCFKVEGDDEDGETPDRSKLVLGEHPGIIN